MSDDTAPAQVATKVMVERAEARPRWADLVDRDSDKAAGMIEVRNIETT